jgi:small redox-active disulfide protein 2
MKIEIIGMGCASCKKLFAQTQEAVKEMGIDAGVEYSDDIQKIVDMGLMSSPVLAIDGQPVISGYVPDKNGIKEAIISGKEVKNNKSGCKCGGDC